MEFNTKISAHQYVAALRLKRTTLYRVIYLICGADLLLWILCIVRAVNRDTSGVATFLPTAVSILVWGALLLILLPAMGYLSYRRNRNIQAEFVNCATPEGFSYKSSSGGSGDAPWTSFSYWRESMQIIILVFPSNIFLIIPKSCLASAQIDEFRAILSTALRRK